MSYAGSNSNRTRTRGEALFWGIILVIIGSFFFLDNFGLGIDVWKLAGDFWPMILIFIGVKNIWVYYMNRSDQQSRNPDL